MSFFRHFLEQTSSHPHTTPLPHTMSVDPHIGDPAALLLSVFFLVSSATAMYQLRQLVLPPFLAEAGHYQFLTNIALCISTLYFATNFVYHGFKIDALYTPKRYLSATAVTINFIVSLIYWSLKLVFPTLIIAEEEHLPLLLDIKIHLVPLAFTSMDYFFYMDNWNIPILDGYVIVALLTVAYWFWLEHLIGENASYPYPFLNVDVNTRIFIFIVVSVIAFGAFCFCKVIHPPSTAKPKTN